MAFSSPGGMGMLYFRYAFNSSFGPLRPWKFTLRTRSTLNDRFWMLKGAADTHVATKENKRRVKRRSCMLPFSSRDWNRHQKKRHHTRWQRDRKSARQE